MKQRPPNKGSAPRLSPDPMDRRRHPGQLPPEHLTDPPPMPADAPPFMYEEQVPADWYMEELPAQAPPNAAWDEPTDRKPSRRWNENTAQVSAPEALALEAPAPVAEPPRRRTPFGGDNLHLPTAISTGHHFQPELQTRIVQNPMADPALAMEQLSERFAAPQPTPEMGKLIVFFSCHGGSGSTMLATNVAASAAQTGRQTCIIDLDLQLGDVMTLLDLEGQTPMSRIAADMESFDWEMLAPLLARHASGLCALSQVGHIEELSELDPGRVPTFLRYLQEHFTCVVVDGLRDFNDHALAAMDVADNIVLVVTQDVAAVRGARIRLDILGRLGYSTARFRVLLNRFDKKSKVTVEYITEALGIQPTLIVPNDYKLVSQGITLGATLRQINAAAPISQALEAVSRKLFDIPEPEPRKGLFARLFGRGG